MTIGPDGFTDLHSHLIPGVDDGSRTLDEARQALGRLRDAGVRRLVTTPHLDGSLTRERGMLEARLGEIEEGWDSLKAVADEEFPGMELHRGHEVMLDIPDPDLSDLRLSLAGTSFVLVEWPGLRVPPSTVQVVERLVDSGVRPIIAHPERYRGLDRETYFPGEWRGKGALLQVNYGSLVGRYGDLPQKRAFALLERGWVDLMASDFHGRAHLSPNLLEARAAMLEAGGGGQFGLLAGVNPARVLRGEDPLSVPPLPIRPGAWQKIKRILRIQERR